MPFQTLTSTLQKKGATGLVRDIGKALWGDLDVSALPVPEREEYPVPLGHGEFVTMLPGEAAKYKYGR